MKILCFGDSLGLPREGCTFEETWISLLRTKYPHHTFIDHFEGARLIDSALSDYNTYYKYYDAEVVILQQGICDCSPRYVNDKKTSSIMIRKAFNTLGLSKLYWRIVKSHIRRPDCVYTQPVSFERQYGKLMHNVLTWGGYFVAVKIGHGTKSVIESSPYFNSNVDRYNQIIDKLSEHKERVYTIDPLNIVNEELFVDGYHCNGKGMHKVYELLCHVIDDIDIRRKG